MAERVIERGDRVQTNGLLLVPVVALLALPLLHRQLPLVPALSRAR